MPAKKISLQNAKEDKLFYFVANAAVLRESDGRCLLLRRSEKEKVHPGKYCMPGGKLEWGMFDLSRPSRRNGDVLDFENAVEVLLAKEVREEAGIELRPGLRYLNSVAFVRPDEIPVILVKFAARYGGGDIRLEEGVFSDYRWASSEEARALDCIEGIPEEIAAAIALARNFSGM